MQYVHFIGIGGAGMSGLAEILIARKIKVSGSDLTASPKTDHLKKLGAKIFLGEHHAKHLDQRADTVVYSSAVKQQNPELVEARGRGIEVFRRAEFLGRVTEQLKTIAIAGTHGKTTTAAMIAHLLIEAGADPLVAIGASVKDLGGNNARAGSGAVAVVEADEYDRSFLALNPYVAVLTSLEAEHLDIYKDIADLENTFLEFANKHSGHEQGFVIVNIDEPALRRILPKLSKRIVTFGLASNEAKYKADNISVSGFLTTASISRAGERIGEITLRIPGEHNIKNALAALAVADILAIPFELASSAMASFKGAERRFELVGEKNGIHVIDDYAHHPTEIQATLETLHKGFPGRKIIAVFQPHTYTRTRDFAEDFGKVFAEHADMLYLLDIYPAREKPISGVTSELILKSAITAGLKSAQYIQDIKMLPAIVAKGRKNGDIIITLGAGSITDAAPLILRNLQ